MPLSHIAAADPQSPEMDTCRLAVPGLLALWRGELGTGDHQHTKPLRPTRAEPVHQVV